jgi:hypothetical protein
MSFDQGPDSDPDSDIGVDRIDVGEGINEGRLVKPRISG